MNREDAVELFDAVKKLWPATVTVESISTKTSEGLTVLFDTSERIDRILASQENAYEHYLVSAIINWCVVQEISQRLKISDEVTVHNFSLDDLYERLLDHAQAPENKKIMDEYLRALRRSR